MVWVEERFSTLTTVICALAMMASLCGLLFAIVTMDYDPNTMVWHEQPVVIASAVWIFAVWVGAIVLFKRPGGGSENGASEDFRDEMHSEIAGLKKDMAQVMDWLKANDMHGGTRSGASP